MKQQLRNGLILSCALLLMVTACRKRDEISLADNLVNFEVAAQGLEEATNSITIKLKLVRSTDRDVAVVVKTDLQDIAYGAEFTTSPANVGGNINLTIPSGNNEASFTLTKTPGALFDGDEKVVFHIYSSASPVFIGATKQLTLSFKELVATSSAIVVNGGGAAYPNKVFIDLSANRQTPVLRSNWDLGFYSGAEDYRVIINSSSAMMAKQVNKTDLAQVTAADTIGFATEVSFNQFSPTTISLPYIDYPNGDLTKTAISSIASNAGDNKVYIVNRGIGTGSSAPARGWKKVRIIRNASGGYTLQHADIGSTTFTSIDIPKDNAYFFKYVSFETGVLNVEPMKKKWDLAWTYFSNVTNFGTGEVPYLFQDIIVQNRNVQVAKVLVATKAFADFGEADIATATFTSSQVSIGADWRSGGGPTSAPAVRTDRYYIIKDGDNNVYKVRFTSLTQNNERGYPAYESVLLKRG
ncbi:MAG: HmuY family protein [Chitinophagaceae bacterium]|nr:HmuY family protein [Chitinophagaceae bacterium]